ncbi:hypothetical protein [Methylocaldum sp.]|jgi:hypothetical protein|uniref:hypothetical protein n=1 Tax=Methylocaldum sp. TaxID=1969727 RepID=UPI0032208689
MIDADSLGELLDNGRASDLVVEWLRQGLVLAIESGDSLERCLGLPEIGGRSWRDYFRHRRAKDLLREAASMIPAGDSWTKAALLSREIIAFRRYRWPRLQGLAEPPETLPDLEKVLFQIFKAKSGHPPESANRIFELLIDKVGHSSRVPDTAK